MRCVRSIALHLRVLIKRFYSARVQCARIENSRCCYCDVAKISRVSFTFQERWKNGAKRRAYQIFGRRLNFFSTKHLLRRNSTKILNEKVLSDNWSTHFAFTLCILVCLFLESVRSSNSAYGHALCPVRKKKIFFRQLN